MKISMVVMTAGKSKGQAIPINVPQFVIGRDPQCNLRPASAVISKRHCAVLIEDGKVFVKDFESTNGTFINEVPVKGQAPLKNEDILKLGPLEFKMIIEDKPVATKPTPPPAKPTPKASEHTDDDSVAAMLLSLQEDGGDGSTAPLESEVPAGSTIMDLNAVQTAAAETPTPDTAKAPTPTKKAPAKNDPAHMAAKAILDKYNRRTRS
jgi:predicted component of type VI protein secretion system